MISTDKILNIYFNQNKFIKIKLKGATVLVGRLVSYYKNEEDVIDRWHFVGEEEWEKYNEDVSIEGGSEYGKIINHSDIESIGFK